MKSIPLLLYLVATGLFGFAGWTVYEMLPMWKDGVRAGATKGGYDAGLSGLAIGKGAGGTSPTWSYTPASAPWWQQLKQVNLIGKLPPPPPEAVEQVAKPVEVAKPVVPLENILEIVSIVYDGQAQGRGGNSHVIVRYKPEANVQPPEWWVRLNTPPTPGVAGPADVTPGRAPVRPGVPPQRRNTPPRAPTPMPTSMVGRELLQQLWVEWPTPRNEEDAAQHSNRLWSPFEDIRLVRIGADAERVFFVRDGGDAGGQPVATAQEEELIKTSMGLSQDVMRELMRLRGQDGAAVASQPEPQAARGTWADVEETTLINGVRHIGRKEAQRFEENGDRFFEQLHVDTYVSKTSDRRGLIVRNVDPRLSSQFGIQAGEVLLEVNGRPVQTQAQAIQLGKADYKRGVRTFVTKWLANGQIIERTYQAPDK